MSHAAQIADLLENMRDRKPNYFLPIDAKTVGAVLSGFGLGLFTCGVKYRLEIHHQVLTDRGWKFNALGFVPPLEEQGLTDMQIVEELLAIEIETWRRISTS
jgi:hypothetical protein